MLIREIEPIGAFGVCLLNHNTAEDIIDRIIELPLQKACKLFWAKGIETVMSSANKNNLLQPGEKPTEKEDVQGQYFFLPQPTFEDAGKGYAWIMLNFDTLSDENKDILFNLESKQSSKGEKIGEKAIWFVRPGIHRNIDYQLKTGELDYFFAKQAQSEGEHPIDRVEVDERYVKFNEKHIILVYNNRYPENTVILRKPINSDSTVEEVEEFFVKYAKLFKEQRVNSKRQEQPDSQDFLR